MKYLKLFEDKEYEEIKSDDYYNNYTKLTLDKDVINKISSILTKYELSKNSSKNILNYDSKKGGSYISIFLIEDDYYFLHFLVGKSHYYYKCDQLNGLKRILNKIKNLS